jgi:tripartite ATP-independent transporter DctM subunit
MEIDWYIALTAFLGLLLLLMALGLPVAFAFFGVNIIGAIIFLNGEAGLVQLVRNEVDSVKKFFLAPLPLFILMGEVMFYTGMAQKAIDAVDRIIARVPGRLSLVAVMGGTIFASLSGSTMANTAMLGSTLLPEMRARGYHNTMSMGPILGTGGIAMLIPPSTLAVLLGSLARIDIATLLIAGIVPGLIIAGLFFTYVITRCALNPSLAPSYDIDYVPFRQRIKPFIIYVVPLLSLFVLVVGSIMYGWATPSESAALGAVGSLIMGLIYRCLSWKALRKAVMETTKITGMAFLIIAASSTFSQIMTFSGAIDGLLVMVNSLDLRPMILLALMLVVLLFLGAFIDQVSMLLITLPFFLPLASSANFDMIWFGVLMLIVMEISLITPPFGLLLFVMKGVVPRDITVKHVYLAAAPFIIMEIIVLTLLLLVPSISVWLPNIIMTR